MNNKDKEIAQKEIVDSLPLKPHGSLILSPRLGKTKIVLDIIKKNKPKNDVRAFKFKSTLAPFTTRLYSGSPYDLY